MRKLLIAVLFLLTTGAQAQNEPIVRIGLNQNAATVTIRSASAFSVQKYRTRSATITAALSLRAGAAAATLKKPDLQSRMVVELDGGVVLALSPATKVRVASSGASLAIENRMYRGAVEVFGNSRNTLTIVNELPVEEYLLGVVPNELSPTTFGQIEALKAQAVAARTYLQRHLGQSKNEGYDICATDACQVYLGAGTEDPTASQAVLNTRGVVATFDGKPIDALYTSTCGGRTESSENIFDLKVPYLVSTSCEYKHPEPRAFSTSRSFPDWKTAVLAVAGVSTFGDAQRFMGLQVTGEPPSADPTALPAFIRQTFYPSVTTTSDESFLTEQGILSPTGAIPTEDLLFRLVDKKGAFEWQQGVLESWDGKTMMLLVNGKPKAFALDGDAPIYRRIGDERLAMRQGSWVGGELMDFRAESDTIRMLVYRINFSNPAADRFFALGHVAGAQDPAGARCRLWSVQPGRPDGHAGGRAGAVGASGHDGNRGLEWSADGARAAASHAPGRARQLVLVRHRAKRSRRDPRRDVVRSRLGPRRGDVSGGRLRHGDGRRDVRRDSQEVLQRHRAETAVLSVPRRIVAVVPTTMDTRDGYGRSSGCAAIHRVVIGLSRNTPRTRRRPRRAVMTAIHVKKVNSRQAPELLSVEEEEPC